MAKEKTDKKPSKMNIDKEIKKMGAQEKKARSAGPGNVNKSIESSREALKHPLDPGMAFFEAPEGWIIVAEAKQQHVWCRQTNGGKGGFINPMRQGTGIKAPKGAEKKSRA